MVLNSFEELWEESDGFHTEKTCPVLELQVDLAFI